MIRGPNIGTGICGFTTIHGCAGGGGLGGRNPSFISFENTFHTSAMIRASGTFASPMSLDARSRNVKKIGVHAPGSVSFSALSFAALSASATVLQAALVGCANVRYRSLWVDPRLCVTFAIEPTSFTVHVHSIVITSWPIRPGSALLAEIGVTS